MATWAEFEASEPGMAAAGRRLLFPSMPGLAYLGTVRADGGPRLHPIMPFLAEGGVYAFIVNLGYKYRDLLRDGRYALHAAPAPGGGEEFYLTGVATPAADAALRERLRTAIGGALGNHEMEVAFHLEVERVLWTEWQGWGTAETWPEFRKWVDA